MGVSGRIITGRRLIIFSSRVNQRYLSVDALRGLIMLIMAVDHSSAFIAREHGSEWWAGAMSSYTSAFPFLTRWITHLCAPGFFFLMGAGICWFAAARRQGGWSESQFAGRVALRGLAIFLTGQFLEGPILFVQGQMKGPAAPLSRVTAPPPIDGTDLYWGLITLSGLGLVMIVCSLLLRLPRWTWWAALAGAVFATNTLLPASGKVGPLWMTVLLAPGLSQHVIVIYPVIPWLAAAAAGMLFAGWWQQQKPEAAAGRLWLLAAGLIAFALLLRAAGGWGNIRPPRDAGWIEFLNNVKYPPSLVFLSLSIGIDLALLAALQRVSARSPLLVFGQTPLFFYLAHFYLLGALGLLFFHEPGSLQMAWAVWAFVIVALYPACVWYRKCKLGKPPESLWRMF